MILRTFHSSLLYSWTVTATHTKNQEKKLEGKILATEQISVLFMGFNFVILAQNCENNFR